MLEKINSALLKVDDIVWGLPLIILILTTGIFLTIRLKGVQFSKLGHGLKNMFSKESGKEGEVSSFGALCTALSATIGTGNIVGVATAIVAGGPGALFWMWLAALVGMATKYAECLLAVKYRKVSDDGHIVGGPFYYIEGGMGSKWKWLAKLFAIFGVGVGLLGIGTFTQINGISNAVKTFFDPDTMYKVNLFGTDYSWTVIITAIVVTLCVALVLLGGLKRISSVAQVIVPFMAVTYVVFAVLVIVINIKAVPGAFKQIFEGAFNPSAVTGGAIGSIIVVMQKGIARGIFSNEAGLGSAPIAAAAANTDEPAKQGLVSMLGTFFDTIVICTMTGLTIVITGSWKVGLEGYAVTEHAFGNGLPFPEQISSFILMLCLIFFAFTTILGWNYYSERCLEYITNGKTKVVKVFRIIYIACVFFGPFMTIEAVWTISDILNGLMAIPNLIALIALSGVVVHETQKYINKLKYKKSDEQ